MKRRPILVLAFLGLGLAASAQEKPSSGYALGGLLSPTNVGITFNSTSSHVGVKDVEDGFHSVSLSADMTNAFLGISKYPGLQVTYNYDFLVGRWESPLGARSLYVGPGVMAGFGDDLKRQMGHILGLNLQFGYDHYYKEHGIHLGIGLNPILGYHLSRNPETGSMDMRLYRYGLIRSLIPQCRVLWELGTGEVPSATDNVRTDPPLITFGVEASGLLELYEYHSFNYMSPFGREDELWIRMISRLAAQIYLHAGFNIKNFMNMSLMVGYQGVGYTTGEAVISTEMRMTYLFKEMKSGNRPLVFIQGGPGWNIMNENTFAGLLKIGGGYRESLSPKVKLDLILGWQFMYLKPKIFEQAYPHPIQIPNENVGRNNEWIGALTWGASISF